MRGLLPAAGLAVIFHVVLFTVEWKWGGEKRSTFSKPLLLNLDLTYKQTIKDVTPAPKPKFIEAPFPALKEELTKAPQERKSLQKTPIKQRLQDILHVQKTSSPKKKKRHALLKSSQPQEKYSEILKNISKHSGPEDPPFTGISEPRNKDLEASPVPATKDSSKPELAIEARPVPDKEEGQLPIFGEGEKYLEATPILIREAVPAYKKNPPPRYPRIARRRGYEGTVIMQVLVDRNGRVKELHIVQSSGHDVLDRAAITSVKNWQFEPGMRGDLKVDTWVKVPVRFQLK
ncbi:MAG: energy transducer TonB [Pseudomonadota bacterium]